MRLHLTAVRGAFPPYLAFFILISHSIGVGTCTTGGGTGGWLCQHRWNAIVGMVGFHNQVGTAAINNWVSPQSQQIGFGRGEAVYVLI